MPDDLSVDVARWLVGDAGLRAVGTAATLLGEGQDELTVATRLRSEVPAGHGPAVVGAAVARRRAAELGYPGAESLVLTGSALEQASRPEVAAWRAHRFADADTPLVDLCCGAGLDTAVLVRARPVLRAVDLDESRVVLARHNLRDRDVSEVVHGDATDPAHVPPGALVHADPSRRRGGRRARRLGDYGPPLDRLLAATSPAVGVAVAVSPAVDWSDPDLPPDAEVEFVQVDGDLVEATLWTGALRRGEATATLLPAGLTWTRQERHHEPIVGAVGAFLVEVAPAAVRARLHDDVAERIGARRVDRGRALLTTDDDPGASPWWRRSRVEAVLSARPPVVRRWLQDRGEEVPLALSSHGLDVDPGAWWRQLGDVPRGPVGRRLHLVRTADGGTCIVTRDPEPDPATG